MTPFEENIRWDGVYYEFLLYVLTPVEAEEFGVAFPAPNGAKPVSCSSIDLIDEGNVLLSGSVRLFSAKYLSLPGPTKEFLFEIMECCSHSNAISSWMMFDGAFHFDHLFTPDVSKYIYGIKFGDLPVQASSSLEHLGSTEWSSSVSEFRSRHVRAGALRAA